MNENPNNVNSAAKTPPPGGFRPRFTLYHQNQKGNGSAIQLELHPAHDDVDGSIFLTLACQKTIGNMSGSNRVNSTFDWLTAMTVKLDFNDLTQMLQVFRGEKENINDDHGLLHISRGYNTTIKFRHLLDPYNGYSFEIYRSIPGKPDADRSGYFFFKPSEALGIATAIENSLGVICFGIPKVIPHDTTAYRRDTREMRNVAAA